MNPDDDQEVSGWGTGVGRSFQRKRFRKVKFKSGGHVVRSHSAVLFPDDHVTAVRTGVGAGSAGGLDRGAGELSLVERQQVLTMERWLRDAPRVNDPSVVGGSTGTDGVVVSASALERMEKQWRKQASTTSGWSRGWSGLTRKFGDIARKLSLPHE